MIIDIASIDIILFTINIIAILAIGVIYFNYLNVNSKRQDRIKQYKLTQPIPLSQLEKYKLTKRFKLKSHKGKREELQCENCQFSFTTEYFDQI